MMMLPMLAVIHWITLPDLMQLDPKSSECVNRARRLETTTPRRSSVLIRDSPVATSAAP
jgi:hypothetical protein